MKLPPRLKAPLLVALAAECPALAGLAAGVYAGPEELEKLRLSERVFTPVMSSEKRSALYRRWQRAVELSRAWGKEE